MGKLIGLPGGGPWVILAECPAENHNSLNAGLGRYRRPACICPQALFRLKDRLRTQREAYTGRTDGTRRGPRVTAHSPQAITLNSVPDFSAGACTTTEHGRRIAREGMNDQQSYGGIAARNAAKELCGFCPMESLCRSYVLSQEVPAGSWGGVWGGLDQWNRKGEDVRISDGRATLVPYRLVDN